MENNKSKGFKRKKAGLFYRTGGKVAKILNPDTIKLKNVDKETRVKQYWSIYNDGVRFVNKPPGIKIDLYIFFGFDTKPNAA